MRIDHVVLWVEDPLASVAFFAEMLGCEPVRVDEFRERKVGFPSVRIADDAIIDLVPKASVPMIEKVPGAAGTAGHKTNHICLAMTKAEYDALRARVEARGMRPHVSKDQYGARGMAPEVFYFKDLDGNVLEARYY
jgi:catechol 2,3-dioxygenase-like lactoylglutathione lyase family enzyme